MGKISVGSLAKTLGVEPKDAIAKLKEIGVDAKTATSQVDEDVVARLTAPQPKDTGTNEVRVASNIIRRRAKVVPAAESAETAVAAAEVTPVQPSVTAPPAEVLPVEAPVAAVVRHVEEGKVTAAVGITVPEAPVEPVKAAEPVKTAEPAKAAEPVKTAEPVKAGPNQARILGMMEIPGVTNRPTRVVTKDTPVTPRSALQRPGQDASQQRRPAPAADQRRPAPGSEARRPSAGYDQKRPASAAPTAPTTELDRSRMKQVQLAPAALPGGDIRRGGKKEGPGYGDASKGAKKGAPPAKKKEQPRKNEIIEKRERAFDPAYRGSKKRGGRERVTDTKKTEITVPKAIKRIIKITESISVGDLAKRLGIKANDLIKSLMKMGMIVTINHPLDEFC
ncbi:MAG: translation initiation factor IF-2 N-terminal domain-containing protein [Desulfuromonadaceae bacterium]|nr:translation initiation factor IF-2 N-terminal domain-containing protein [Desulfuromonadaceae bacterium]